MSHNDALHKQDERERERDATEQERGMLRKQERERQKSGSIIYIDITQEVR